MKRILSTGLLLLLIMRVNCQINIADSTTQVIGFWDINEKQTYLVSNEKLKIQEDDTISREFTKYEVDITIQDTIENGYLINWFYRDYEVETDNELIKKLSSVIEDMNVQIKTDDLGIFVEVVNWEEIRDYIIKGTSMLKDELKTIPNMDKLVTQWENMYNSKQAIEAGAINEILQFHYFHGLKYKLWEDYTYDNKLANMFGGEPFDAKVTFWLDEINDEDNNAIYRMHQSVDSVQLTNETFKYLTKMAETMQTPPPKREEFSYLHSETRTASRIHGTGWPIYSIQTREITTENVIQIEECIIELK